MTTVSTANKIDVSNFRFIGVKDQYMLGIAVETETSGKYINFFSREADLISYVDVCKTGFNLPAVEIVFACADRKLIPYLNEGARFAISIGKDLNSQKQSSFNIVSAQIQQPALDKWLIRIIGIYDALDYVKTTKKQGYNKSSVEIAKILLKRGLGKEVKVSPSVRSNDTMFWMQSSRSDYHYLHEVWMHSYIENSLWLAAIDFEGTPKIVDLRQQAKSVPKITLTTGAGTSKDVYSILGNFQVDSNSSVANSAGGYVQSTPVHSIDDAITKDVSKKNLTFLTYSDVDNRNENVISSNSYRLSNSNVHEHYHDAPMTNASAFLKLKTVQLGVSVEGKFVPVDLLDYVMLKDTQGDGQAQEDYSGLYMVGKVSHQIENKKIYTHIDLWRESQNKVAQSDGANYQAKNAISKIDSLRDKINSVQSLLTPSSYTRLLNEYAKVEEKITKLEEGVSDKVLNSAAYKHYKTAIQKYREIKNYMNQVYMVSSTIATVLPFMDDINSKFSEFLNKTPNPEALSSAIRSYADLRSEVYSLESQIAGKIESTEVLKEYRRISGKFNEINNTISTLQNMGIIGDIDEYLQSLGQ